MKAKEKQSKGDGDFVKTIFLGLDLTPNIIVFSAIYFVEGTLGLARLVQTFLVKDGLHLSPAKMSATMGILALPWTIEPLYGYLSDGFPIARCGLTLNRCCLSNFKVRKFSRMGSFPSLPVLTIIV